MREMIFFCGVVLKMAVGTFEAEGKCGKGRRAGMCVAGETQEMS